MKYSQKHFLLAGLLLLLQTAANGQDLGGLDLDDLDAYIEESRNAGQVPGLAIAIVKNDSVVFAKGYGVREYGKPEKVDENTVFCIASITKTFTSSALAMLNDEEKIDWDDPVRDYLPDFKLYNSYVNDEIRIRDLLCHRSGLKTFSGDLVWFETNYSRKEVLLRARYLEPVNGFRYNFGYSNLMFLTAGEIIPVVTNRTWETYIKEELLNPLGMNRTFLDLDGFEGDPNVAMPHHVDLLHNTTQVMPFMKFDNVSPAASMNSNVMDLSNWIRFQLKMGNWNGEQLINTENLWETRKMHTPRPLEEWMPRIWPSKHFAGYGLGWDLYDYHGWKIIAHEGGTDGMLTRLVIVPEENFGFVILTNSMNAITMGLENVILDKYYNGESYDWCSILQDNYISYKEEKHKDWETYLESADRTSKPTRKLKDYQGKYGGDLYGEVEVKLEKGGLVLDFLPSDRMIGDLELFSGDTFLIKLREMPFLPQGTVKFYLDENGEVKELAIDIPNPDFDFTELELKRDY